jgi:hypothetical protein
MAGLMTNDLRQNGLNPCGEGEQADSKYNSHFVRKGYPTLWLTAPSLMTMQMLNVLPLWPMPNVEGLAHMPGSSP